MAHVFIVNEETFKTHLEYLFAGTGASDVPTDFIFDSTIELGSQDEKRSVGMITDLARIKKGDKILFFVTGISKFYGIFEANSDFFVDPNDENNYLFDLLSKKLTYRIQIKPWKVYENGISEFEYLDSLDSIKYPDQMCWSLIYRKLDGKRGCTMITDWELELFEKKISIDNKLLKSSFFTYDKISKKIISTNTGNQYLGRQFNIDNDMQKNMFAKFSSDKKRAFEHYVQYMVINYLKNEPSKILASKYPVRWIGNEVYCGFGMQRIDCLSIQENDNEVIISVIELKDERITLDIVRQIKRYLNWLKFYILPYFERSKKKISVEPIIISDCVRNNRQSSIEKLENIENEVINQNWSEFDTKYTTVLNAKIIHFQADKNHLFL